jgi:HK97 family phage prohead protease/HK97 family phage major capsid protein
MTKIYRNTDDCQLRALENSRTIEGYAVVFNQRSVFLPDWNKGRMVEEVMMPGSITEELIAKSDVVANIDHDNSRMVARSVNGEGSLRLMLDDHGLKFSFEAPLTNDGETVLQGVRRGDFRGCSFAYTCDEDTGVHYEKNDKDSRALIRYVDEVNGLYDVSVVIHPAYPQTNVDSRAAVLDGALMRGMIENDNKENEYINPNSNSAMEENKKNENVEEPKVDNTAEVEALKNEVEGMKRSITDLQAGQDAVSKKVSSIKVREEKKRNFSLIRAIREFISTDGMSDDVKAVIRAGREEMNRSNLTTYGDIIIPQQRASVTVTAEHDDTIGIDVYNTFAPIREGLVAVKAGARFYPGLVGELRIPVLSAGNAAWTTEVGSAPDPSYSFASVNLAPHRLTAQFKLSKQMVAQDGAQIEANLLADIRKAVITKLNATMFGTAAASGGAPKGIGNGQTAAVATDWAKLTTLVEAAVERLAVGEEYAYIASPEAAAVIRQMTYNKTTRLIYEAGNVDGTPLFKTIGCAANQGYYGDWGNLVIGQWGALDLTVDPYTAAGTGELVITINSYFDYGVARAGSLKLFTTVAAGS